MALIDALRKKQQQLARQTQPAPTSVQQMRESITTGMTGREQRQAGPATSSIGQQVAQQQAQAQQQALTQQQDLQAQQLGRGIEAQEAQLGLQQKQLQARTDQALKGIEAEEQMATERRAAKSDIADMQLSEQEAAFSEKVSNAYANRIADLASERGIVENNLLADFRRETASLEKDKQLAALSQLGHDLALADQRYVSQIQKIGALQGLRDDLEFQREADRLAFGGKLDILSERMDQQRILKADQREFAKMMSEIQLEDALKIAEEAQRAANTQSMVDGLFTIGSAYAQNKMSTKGNTGSNSSSTTQPSTSYFDSASTGYQSYFSPTSTENYTPKDWWE